MEKKNNNGVLIGILIGIIVMLLIFVGLFATNTISFNTKEVSNNNQAEKNQEEKQTNEKESKESSITGYYQNINKYAEESYTITEIALKSDNTVSYIIGSANNSISNTSKIMTYSGTYLEKDSDIILSIISTDNECKDGKYACKDIIYLHINNDGTISNNNQTPNEIYNKVEKEKLLMME